MVVWLIGLSGSGKTSIGKELFRHLENSNEKWVFLDGDVFRNILGEDLGHSEEDRIKNGYRISRFCQFLSHNNLNVIACVLSISHKNQKYNRDNIEDYKEVYIDVSFEKLLERDNKALYKNAANGKIKNVVGVDINFSPPLFPDIIIRNDKDLISFENHADQIIQDLNIEIDKSYKYTKKDLLNHPTKYEYSNFQGKNFFDNFLFDRNEAILFFRKRLDELEEHKFNFKNLSNKSSFKDFKINNEYSLRKFLLFILNANDSIRSNYQTLILTLIQRFEVSKKLYESYISDRFKKKSNNYHDILNYSLFSLVLQKYYSSSLKKNEKLIFLNSILKLNDIISSKKSDIYLPDDVRYSLSSVEGELLIIKTYL
jgi:cytidine diphosphoramidate kinase